MFIVYSLGTENKRVPTERAVHVIDTELPERFYVSYVPQSDRAVRKTVNEIDDFVGNMAKDLTKPLIVLGVSGDSFGHQLIEELIKRQPVYVDCKASTINRALK